MFIPALLFFFTFFFYLRTSCASFNINDSGETIMVCDLLTISHSPGYPLHTLWGRVNCLLPIGQPMFRVTFCSMLTATVAVVMVYWLLKMLLKGVFDSPTMGSTASFSGQTGESITNDLKPGPWIWEIPALFGALIFAFSYQHWFQACGAKGGIYTLNTLLASSMLYLFFKMREKGWFIKSFLLMGFLLGLSFAHHWPNLMVMAPAYLWFIIIGQKKIPLMNFLGWSFQPLFMICTVLFSVFAFVFSYGLNHDFLNSLMVSIGLLAASIMGWVIVRIYNWFYLLGLVLIFVIVFSISQSPLVSAGIFFIFGISLIIIRIIGLPYFLQAFITCLLSLSIYVYLPIRATQNPLVNWWNPQTVSRLWGTVLREGYKGVGDLRGWATVDRDLKRFFLHAHHQFGNVFTFFVLALVFWGCVWLWNKKQWPNALGIAFFGGGVFMGIILFNNPLEGYQWTIDNFFSPFFLMCAMFAAAGIAGICEWISREWPHRLTPLYASAFCMSFALMPLILNYKANAQTFNGQIAYEGNDQSRYVSSYDEGMNMLKTVNDNGVILCNGDIDILPLWYLQYVEGKRPKVVSFTMQLIPYDWYRNPLFERWPFLKVAVDQDIRPETVVQNMIEQHGVCEKGKDESESQYEERIKDKKSFYFTNIFTAPWMRDKNPSLPEGFLWRMIQTKDLNYPFSSSRLNIFWDTYRLRYMDEPDRGYWDEYTDVMKDSYGIGHDFTGYFAYMNKMPDIALWSFNNALKYRQVQTLMRIYLMLGETYLALGDPGAAINNYQESLRRDPHNPYAYAKIGDAFRMMGNVNDAEQAYRACLNMNPQQKEALDGLQELSKAQQLKGAPGNKHT